MSMMRILAVTISFAALSACGTHESVAPKAQGAGSTVPAPIYNTPEETRVAAQYQEPQTQQRPRASRAGASSDVDSARLRPVSAVYLSDQDNVRLEPANYQATNKKVSGARMVEVRKGDTVYALGRRYDVHPKAIIAANNLRAPYNLSIGQKILLPGAAVTVASTQQPVQTTVKRDAQYRVQAGDTLYAISRKTGVSVPLLAQANNLNPPYTLSPGQIVLAPGANSDAATLRTAQNTGQKQPALVEPARPAPSQQVAAATPAPKPETKNVADLAKQVSFPQQSNSDAMFVWPLRGAIVAKYGGGELGKRNDGINIAAPAGTPVRAAADGEVVYRGSELEGFGNLLLVKHADGFVTAYAHNDAMLVKKGDVVRQGQVIAKVGKTGAVSTPQLHFEIRQKLKSLDPVALLETR